MVQIANGAQAEKCPHCGRMEPLGALGVEGADPNDRRCVDCWFGPPTEYWETCPACGRWGVHIHKSTGLECEQCGAVIRPARAAGA